MFAVEIPDDRPIAVRRKRRSTANLIDRDSQFSETQESRHAIDTPPTTPRRTKKRVRFSDPGPPVTEDFSTGLTPFVRRASLTSLPSASSTPRRRSTPSNRWNRAENDLPLAGTIQFAPLRQVLEGRVKRRLQRNRLSEEVNRIESDNRRRSKSRKAEVERLRHDLKEKDREMQDLRDELDLASQIGDEAGMRKKMGFYDDTKVEELESEIDRLRAELQAREAETTIHDTHDWTMAAQDPFAHDDDDDGFMPNYDDDFDDSMADVMHGTPARLNIPSPPSTMPGTPSRIYTSTETGAQASLEDPETVSLKDRLATLCSEVTKLSAKVELSDTQNATLAMKLSAFMPVDQKTTLGLDAALDSVLSQLATFRTSAQDTNRSFQTLGAEIDTLGFSGSDAQSTVANIASQFRQARLDLEYLAPGENTEGFENDKLLSMLVNRVRTLLEQVKARESDIDQYHEQELLLRQQLGGKVDALTIAQGDLASAQLRISQLGDELKLSSESNEKLKLALEGYRIEVSGLESLIEKMETEHNESDAQLRREMAQAIGCLETDLEDEKLRRETACAEAEANKALLHDFEQRLSAALSAADTLKAEMEALSASKDGIISELNASNAKNDKVYNDALAFRDTKINELKEELERVNGSLAAAHHAISRLRTENKDITTQLTTERSKARIVVQSMRDQIMGVMNIGTNFLGDDGFSDLNNENSFVPVMHMSSEFGISQGAPLTPQSSGREHRFLDGDLARKGKKKRRYDSGLGFLEEEEIEDVEVYEEVA
jgi:hypothetical protein